MAKEEIIQKFYDRIAEGISDSEVSAKDTKKFAVAFKIIHNIEQNDDFLKQLAEMPKASKGVTIQPILQVDDDGVFGQCD